MDAAAPLSGLRASRDAGHPAGLVSVCSAHELVIEAALAEARDSGATALVEATCNQVNQEGGYTGMRPADFRDRVHAIAERVALPRRRIVLGGDHLGPNPWTGLPAPEAMDRAAAMVAGFVAAGFEKIHLDCSMACAGDPRPLPDAEIASRAAALCRVAEAAARDAGTSPCYVVGTEVPVPGGATDIEDHLAVTDPAAVRETLALHRDAFAAAGIADAVARIIAIVVQPGVEFGSRSVHFYDPAAATGLVGMLDATPGLVFEAHSTDYQRPDGLAALVRDGFAILKVGPWLTFALREALYGLDAMRRARDPAAPSLPAIMERLMLAHPAAWRGHYHGDDATLRLERHFSFSDRIRYYWDLPEARAAVDELLAMPAPDLTLVSQYLPRLADAVRDGRVAAEPRALAVAHVRLVLDLYRAAAGRY